MNITDAKNKLLKEDINDFQVGKTSQTKTGKHTITDIDPETQSITWAINKKITDSDIYNDIDSLVRKLELYKDEYNNEKRLNSLLQKLKFIRNTFKRTSIKEIKINKLNVPLIPGKYYKLKLWHTAENIEDIGYEPADDTILGEEGYYWFPDYEFIGKDEDSENLKFEDILSGYIQSFPPYIEYKLQ
jgi:hypothetical protein